MQTARTSDAPDLHLRALGIELASTTTEKREASFVASTASIDSHGEIVEQDWDLSRFKANPVVLYAHQSRELPIGSCTRVDVVAGRLECTVKFASAAASPLAESVYQLVKEGTLRAVSVGFIPGDARLETRAGRDVVVLSKNVLHEISIVPIPSNADAVAITRAKAFERGTGVGPAHSGPPFDDYEMVRAIDARAERALRGESIEEALDIHRPIEPPPQFASRLGAIEAGRAKQTGGDDLATLINDDIRHGGGDAA